MASPNANSNDITQVLASLAPRQAGRPKSEIPGPQRAAMLMLALGEQYGGKIWSLLDDDEVRELSLQMSTLGTVEADRAEDMALDVVGRMLKMEAVQKEVIERVEQTLRVEFMSNLSQTRRRDAHEVMAEIFNNFDRQTETRFITALEEENRESAERIKALMFTFDDLIKLDSGSAQTLMRNVDKDKLGVALKSANEEVKGFFLGNMSSRAGKMLMDDMAAMGPVRLRDVDEAQALLVNLAKDLAAKGEIMLTKNRADDELVY